MPLGSSTNTGNIRDVYLFNGAINSQGMITTNAGVGSWTLPTPPPMT